MFLTHVTNAYYVLTIHASTDIDINTTNVEIC